jgi:DNA-binding protein HU-beta
VTKAEAITAIADKSGIDRASVSIVLEDFFDLVRSELAKDGGVYVRGFGSFANKRRAAKKARNISKMVTVDVPAHSVPTFRPAKEFVQVVKGSVK